MTWQEHTVKASKVGKLLKSSCRCHIFCCILLYNINVDGDKISLRFLFFLYVTLMVLCGKIPSICWLLYKIGKCFLMMVLRLGNKGLYCVIKLHEVEKVVLTDLGFICILQKGTCGCYHRAIGRLPITRIYITHIYSVGYEHYVSWVIVFLQWNTRFSGSGPPTFWILPNYMNSANAVSDLQFKLLNERALSTGEPCTFLYVTLLQSFHRGAWSIHWYIAKNF